MPRSKPKKPHPEFPLFAHASGVWAKKHGGKHHYFGTWDDPEGALREYEAWLGGGGPNRTGPTNNAKASRKPSPQRPYPGFPLYAHANGQWAKRIRGRVHYFGPWSNHQEALDRYLQEKDDLLAGRDPAMHPQEGDVTLRELLNEFLAAKRALLESEEIVRRTFDDYHTVCRRLTESIDKHRMVSDLVPEDFQKLRTKLAKTRGPTSLTNDITRIRVIFKFAYENGLIDRPVRFGQALKRPSRKDVRKSRNKAGPRMFEAGEIRRMLDAATNPLHSMILLGINCGFGNQDCGTLPRYAVNLETGWLHFPRPKTGIPRDCPLWPETVLALRKAMKTRPQPTDAADDGLVFITSKGNRFAKEIEDNPISKEMRKLLEKLNLYRKCLGFYAIRHTFATIGGRGA